MTGNTLHGFIGSWLPRLENEMRDALRTDEDAVAHFYGMLHYHLGWVDEQFAPQTLPAGKRLRPMLCLLACAEVGGDPVQALPAAAGIEILHNFSLIHDDLEDGDETRRHRPTVWKLWGMPQAVNAGDGMFAMAYAAIQRLRSRGVAAATAMDALDLFTSTCIALTEGQYMDISFETRADVMVDEYMRMIQGKTASLIGASVAIGALIGGATAAQDAALQRFGQQVGLAFQIQDDMLGVWGDPAVTGKAAGNDILRRKKSLPLLYALNHPTVGARLSRLFAAPLRAAELPQAMNLLDEAGAKSYSEGVLADHHAAALAALRDALGAAADGSTLYALADSLLHRQT